MLDLSHQQGTLYLQNLYEILPQYRSEILTDKLEKNWLEEVEYHPQRASLIRATIRTVGWKPFLIGLYLLLSVS